MGRLNHMLELINGDKSAVFTQAVQQLKGVSLRSENPDIYIVIMLQKPTFSNQSKQCSTDWKGVYIETSQKIDGLAKC